MINKTTYDVVIVGAGIMGCTTALHLAKSGMKTLLIDRGKICREASGVNAGTLTIHMTRAQLIPYAIKGWELWMNSKKWLGGEIEVTKAPGLCLAFSEEDEKLLVERSKARIEQGAPIKLIENDGSSFLIKSKNNNIIKANKIVLAGGVWLEEMLKWFNINIEVKCLPQQLIITERIQTILKTVITIANGKLSMKQFSNGTTLIGGGWPGNRNINYDKFEHLPENLIGNMQLACHSIPSLKKSRVLRVWGGLEAETKDAMPIMDTIPQNTNAFVIGSFHSGYTSGPYVGYLMSKIIQGEDKIHHDLFSLSRLL